MTRVFFSISVAILATAMFSEDVYSQVITISTKSEGEVTLLFLGSGTVSVDWGDGSPKETQNIGERKNVISGYARKYSGGAHTITLTGKNITHFWCYENDITDITITDNTSLKFLCCHTNQLTELDAGGNKSLEWLSCGSNLLNTAALNALFKTLPAGKKGQKSIFIDDTPCKQSIAEKKGWRVKYSTEGDKYDIFK